MNLPYADDAPALRGLLKSDPEDFVVDELLAYGPDGNGEHDWLQIEKRGVNTAWLAGQLARYAKVPELAIGYAGLKDRHGLTRQSFTVQLPGRTVDWSGLDLPGVKLLAQARHSRKIQRGSNEGNRFAITLRAIEGDRERAEQQLRALAAGIPNYFTEQRFGSDGSNLARARALFAGRRLDRQQRSHALSAARSAIFNAVLAARVVDRSWNTICDGELLMLDDSRAWFDSTGEDRIELERRCAAGEIHPTGPLWGDSIVPGEPLASFEDAASGEFDDLKRGLSAERLKSARRALRVRARELGWQFADDALRIEFALPAGAYATAVIRQVCRAEQ